jgi:hypothetical protein
MRFGISETSGRVEKNFLLVLSILSSDKLRPWSATFNLFMQIKTPPFFRNTKKWAYLRLKKLSKNAYICIIII